MAIRPTLSRWHGRLDFLYTKFLDMTEAEIMAKIKDKDVPLRERLFLGSVGSRVLPLEMTSSYRTNWLGTPKQTFTGDITREVGLSIDEIRNFVIENNKVNDNDNL